MLSDQGKEGDKPDVKPQQSHAKPPAISLPTGGGAIRGMGEKFAANPVTGTGSLSVPIATSPGRTGFGPQLSLSYDSGAGNGPFGFGWSLTLPSITRKTDKGLPQYRDAEESDVFLLSGAEDLVPVLVPTGATWSRAPKQHRTVDHIAYDIQRYRPRIEGLFARIERWTNQTDPQDSFWRSISKDNITTWYGKTAESRIADPADPTRIFSWLICESHDDKGNVIVYHYKKENSDHIQLAQAHERNRTDLTRQANRYLKRIRYGNHTPYLPTLSPTEPWPIPPGATASDGSTNWYFEVVFDYGEHDSTVPRPNDAALWSVRPDPFSTYRATFDVRTYRLCQRVLMFHHFANEPGVGRDCLVRSTDFTYASEQTPTDPRNPIYSLLHAVTHTAYTRQGNSFLSKALPPLEFTYTQPTIDETVRDVDDVSLENLPAGLDEAQYQWVDLHGEGLSGILAEYAGSWWYKRNLSPMTVVQDNGTQHTAARFAPVEQIAEIPSTAAGNGGPHQFLDLAGDGQLELVTFEGPAPGFFERTTDEHWHLFTPFTSLPILDWNDPHLKFVDLTGDGHADLLINEDTVFCWHASLAEAGFGPAQRVSHALDEERGPRLVFADSTQSMFLADLSGDGLTDLVRIRNGEVCYWPNLGYGRFGAKVSMDNAPWFETPDVFDGRRLRLADIDGTGTTDIIYLATSGVQIYFNQSGNGWSARRTLRRFPPVENASTVTVLDLLGNGTACLVWSSPLPGDAPRPIRYIDLMGGQKPHLLVQVVNNLGAETHVSYAPSTQFYLIDKYAGRPWITKLPFPVHVVERVETCDVISRTRFVTRYAYHHGYFDGVEREFRGFGMVEQFDTEEFAVLSASGTLPKAVNLDAGSHVPPAVTRTWFHTGAYLEGAQISRQFEHEYYLEGDGMLLPDTILPTTLTRQDGGEQPWALSPDERREACRALKGAMLRQEIYAQDGSAAADRPYSVSERNYSIALLQPRGVNQHAVFFTQACETMDMHYERMLYEGNGQPVADPRVTHAMTLEVDGFGNILQAVAIGYGRRHDDPDPLLTPQDRAKQHNVLITYTENGYTKAVDEEAAYRAPLPCEARTYELTGYTPTGPTGRFQRSDFVQPAPNNLQGLAFILRFDSEIAYEAQPTSGRQRRLIEHGRTLYRKDDLTGPLPFGQSGALALPFESYTLAFTHGLVRTIYVDSNKLTAVEMDSVLANEGRYIHSQGDANWWIPSGQAFFHPNLQATPAQELALAKEHFYLPRRFRDPFQQPALVRYDAYDLLLLETEDALHNKVTAGARDSQGGIINRNDYRVLQAALSTDPNGNQNAVAFDILGLVAGTAVMGKNGEGDSLQVFVADVSQVQLAAFFADPKGQAATLLGKATTRIVYDVERYVRTGNAEQPPFAAILARERHVSDLQPGEVSPVQVSLSYSDGFGREIQKKIQAEPGPVVTAGSVVTPRWVGSGWTIFNNKGQPFRQYEPFFSSAHEFEFARTVGVSSTLFYDPVGRGVATLHPNHTYGKVAFDPWRQATWDVNDTALQTDPKADADVGDFFRRLPNAEYLPTWYSQRLGGVLGPNEQAAGQQMLAHAGTPAVAYLDTLGRSFLTIADNGTAGKYASRVELDIEGNQRAVIDAKDRTVMTYDYDMLGTKVHQVNMEAGARWMLHDVAGKPVRTWDSRGHMFRTQYDALRRPVRAFVHGTDPANSDPRTLNRDILFAQTDYGEGQSNDTALNMRTRVLRQYDGAGIVTHQDHHPLTGQNESYDFKGNLLRSTRQLVQDYKGLADWSANPPLEPEIFHSATTYDAMNRPATMTTPDQSLVRPTYNEANLLERMDVNLRGAATPTAFVTNINYNAKGQRELIQYGNGVSTTYTYDPLTFRLIRLTTTRPANLNGLAMQLFRNPSMVQDLHYTFDPVGNITRIADDALPALFHANQRVDPVGRYAYDALYRLIQANGREHIGQSAFQLDTTNGSNRDYPFAGLGAQPFDSQAVRTYAEQYDYDEVGNILRVVHQAQNGGWTRNYRYTVPSLIEPSKISNRLSQTTVGTTIEPYAHDMHGNMTSMPHLPVMKWDCMDWLSATSRQVVNAARPQAAVPEATYYVYDASGQRVRKVTERQNGTRKNQRLYLGGFEIYRDFDGSGAAITLERQSLHIMDDKQRVALVEARTQGDDGSPVQLVRYQFGNHLGSASLELDDAGQVISYEEYYPYGATSYQAGRSTAEVGLKRYRYTGKERDEETGFTYHVARHYAPWLGRWTSIDPAAIISQPSHGTLMMADGAAKKHSEAEKSEPKHDSARSDSESDTQVMNMVSLYAYGDNGPINKVDPMGTTIVLAKDMSEKAREKIQQGLQTLTGDLIGIKRRDTGEYEVAILESSAQPSDRPAGTHLVGNLIKSARTISIDLTGVSETKRVGTKDKQGRQDAAITWGSKEELITGDAYGIEGKAIASRVEDTPSYIALGHELIHAWRITEGRVVPESVRTHEFIDPTGWKVVEKVRTEELIVTGILSPRLAGVKAKGLPITENILRREHGLRPRIAYANKDQAEQLRVGP